MAKQNCHFLFYFQENTCFLNQKKKKLASILSFFFFIFIFFLVTIFFFFLLKLEKLTTFFKITVLFSVSDKNSFNLHKRIGQHFLNILNNSQNYGYDYKCKINILPLKL